MVLAAEVDLEKEMEGGKRRVLELTLLFPLDQLGETQYYM